MAATPQKYFLISLPQSISPSNNRDEAITALRSSVTTDFGTTTPFGVPTFKVGALDTLMTQADDLAKLTNDCESIVTKVGDSLAAILDGEQDKIRQQRVINDRPPEQYLQTFQWNKVKYRLDKHIAEIMDSLRKEATGIDADVRNKFQQYNAVRNNLLAAQRKQTGTLATKSLLSIVSPDQLVTDSEYLETHLIAVPKVMTKDWLKSYETLCPMVVPRSATVIDTDAEFTLYAVTTFKKTASEFVHKCREKRWTPRDFRYREGGREEEEEEVRRLEREERKLWGEALRLGRTGFSEAAATWIHALCLRMFVESVLRYGLPPEFVSGLVQTTPKLAKKAKGLLDANYQYLGGAAVPRDAKGRPKREDPAMGAELQAAGQADGEWTPYVFFEFELS